MINVSTIPKSFIILNVEMQQAQHAQVGDARKAQNFQGGDIKNRLRNILMNTKHFFSSCLFFEEM